MAPSRALCEGVALVRPLLAMSRRVVRQHLVSLEQPWREDATNADIRYARNFLRNDILPQCEAAAYPAATQSLVRLGALAAGLTGAVRSAAEHLLEQCGCQRAAGAVVIRRAVLAGLDPQLVAEVFVALWEREGWPRRDMTATHFARLARMAAFPGPAVDLPGGVRCHLAADGTLRLGRPADDVRPA
jgi:tRNA(Ile)-lysidine synthase